MTQLPELPERVTASVAFGVVHATLNLAGVAVSSRGIEGAPALKAFMGGGTLEFAFYNATMVMTYTKMVEQPFVRALEQ